MRGPGEAGCARPVAGLMRLRLDDRRAGQFRLLRILLRRRHGARRARRRLALPVRQRLRPAQGESLRRQLGRGEIRCADVAALTARDLPGRADLAWASFPCQDLSLAGLGAGLSRRALGRVLGLSRADARLARRGPRAALIVLENVLRRADVEGRRRFRRPVRRARRARLPLRRADDRRRAFRAAIAPAPVPRRARRDDVPRPNSSRRGADAPFAAPALRRAVDGLPPPLAARLAVVAPARAAARATHAHRLPRRRPRRRALARRASRPARCIAAMSPASRAKLAARAAPGRRRSARLFRRTRPDGAGGASVRAEARFDGLAGCLRTPAGGSSRQFLLASTARRDALAADRRRARRRG